MKLTKQQIIDLSPCADGLAFAKSRKFNIVQIWNTCERGDWLIWLLQNTNAWKDKAQKVEVAVACAEHVLVIFENKYSDDKRPRQAIEAAKLWIESPTPANEQK